ncbi:phage/conjugal plasmid C-4 type zinc finger TraR family protein [Agrobacterium vitis]|nr:phage/conjugal plasmid C-4 type zinc finger TraR family protein [Agrobacterium vitis]MBE1439623.1 phage/conjugal plasmid C-4 type zinc finger TraR family protein [Agrobacterium vitis]
MLHNLRLELADELACQARDARLTEVRADLKKPGGADCVDCERPIPPARRLAYPSAIRCIQCQTITERRVGCR